MCLCVRVHAATNERGCRDFLFVRRLPGDCHGVSFPASSLPSNLVFFFFSIPVSAFCFFVLLQARHSYLLQTEELEWDKSFTPIVSRCGFVAFADRSIWLASAGMLCFNGLVLHQQSSQQHIRNWRTWPASRGTLVAV